ncbi:hypothetical protein WA026_001996 [Henosepilachna vigintioctopunctata]|uniref:Active regulator of SIRT1 n=1 Tax=Henosepilachna vigintioctopunctata TaxID=420089 RepID=A0AAW1UUY7_9CUCU
MSSSIVKQSLAILESDDLTLPKKNKKEKKTKDIFAGKHLKDLQGTKKISLSETRKTLLSKEEIYKKNLKKLELLKQVTTLKLDEEIKNRIIQRNVTKRPVKGKSKKKKDKKTVFTEEDFKKFEEEYTGE